MTHGDLKKNVPDRSTPGTRLFIFGNDLILPIDLYYIMRSHAMSQYHNLDYIFIR